jgi:hypothetical protein
MKLIATGLVLALGVLVGSMQPSLAQSSMMAMPKCASGDSIVGVNTTTKTYMTQAQMQAKSSGMTPAQKQAMMAKNHVKLMCKSAAVKMGAKPAPSM